jgi:hypothetical protein
MLKYLVMVLEVQVLAVDKQQIMDLVQVDLVQVDGQELL